MEDNKCFFAVDLGATSGRTLVGSFDDGKLVQRELTRFPNAIIETCGHYYWDIYALYAEIVRGLKQAADEGLHIASIGIDTWGCDFVLLGRDGGVFRNPYCYRDPHTDGAMEQFFNLMPREEVYRTTGIQFMNFNSLFQLHTLRRNRDSALEAASKILFIPDALMYMLTGEMVCEYTVLSTSQLLDVHTRQLSVPLLRQLELDPTHFGWLVQPGEQVGTLSEEVQRQTGLGDVPVIAVAGHDTASAVAAVPSPDSHFAYLSCGTWSLLGIETEEPIVSDESLRCNFTNEGGIDGTTRFLKNICGMWLLEQCRKEWASDPSVPSDVNRINADAMDADPFRSFINPDDPRFAHPDSMVTAIRQYCEQTGQPVPQDYRDVALCIFQSLALRYRQVLDMLRRQAPFPIERLHVIGGGTHNTYLMQFTADCIGIPVVTGPVEGTAIGNIMLQARAAGLATDRFDMRRQIAQSIRTVTYTPVDVRAWDEAYERFCDITGRV